MAEPKRTNALLPWLIVFGLWAVLHGTLAATVTSSVFHGQLAGPDEYMRLVRVAELRDGNGWYDGTIERSNAPYGDTLHWTRPLDLLILGVASVASPFAGAQDALFVAGVVVSPLLALAACFAVAWAAYPIMGRDRAIFAAFIFLIQPGVLAYTMAGRADHHSLLFVLAALVIGGGIRIVATRVTTPMAATIGAIYGLAIWTSIEMTLLVALCQVAAVLSWIRFPQVSARTQSLVALAFLATMLLALVAEHPPAALWAVELDRISLPYGVIAVLKVAVWSAAWFLERRYPETLGPRQRLVAMSVAGAGAAALLLALFPGLVAGPLAGTDPRLQALWHAHVAENHPLAPTTLDRTGEFLFFLGTVAITIPYAVLMGWRDRASVRGMPWFFLAAVAAVYLVLALQRFRLAPFAEIASAPLLADMIARLIDWSERHLGKLRRLLVNCTATFALMCGSMLAGAYLMTLSAEASDETAAPECAITEIAPLLSDPKGLGATPLIVSGLLDHGPELLYRTPHSVVATPYHRNGAGIWDSYRILTATDDSESRAIAARRGIDLLLLCPSGGERRFFDHDDAGRNLYSRLLRDEIPGWLAPVTADPATTGDFRLYRILR